VPIWSPVEMVLQAADIPASWEVTSDSLAAWLAGRIGTARLLLVKHGAFAGEPIAAADLVARGVVDPAFPRYLAASRAQAFIVAADDPMAVAEAVGQGRTIGASIVLAGAAAERVETS
jgi:5-(aminomethyl)-3-furanmethanol phosphate kinase